MSAAPRLPGFATPKTKTSGPLLCKWSGCDAYENCTEFSSVDELARHVRTAHVEPLESQDVVVCQWENCKVFNVPSSSVQWLKRHVQQVHTKDRPFKCIMNGCIMSFNTREALQRHVNRHLEPSVSPASSPAASSPHQRQTATAKTGRALSSDSLREHRLARKIESHYSIGPFYNDSHDVPGGGKTQQSRQTAPSSFVPKSYSPLYQLCTDPPPPPHQRFEVPSDSSYDSSEDNRRRLGRKKPLSLKIRIPRRSISLSSLYPTPYNGVYIHTDVWDRKMMSVVHQTCNRLTQDSNSSKNLCITLKAKILGQRRSHLSEEEFLVRWTPRLADDCWVPVSQFSPQKSVPFSQITEPYLSLLASTCFSHPKTWSHRRKRK